jgi:hypothetical protein
MKIFIYFSAAMWMTLGLFTVQCSGPDSSQIASSGSPAQDKIDEEAFQKMIARCSTLPSIDAKNQCVDDAFAAYEATRPQQPAAPQRDEEFEKKIARCQTLPSIDARNECVNDAFASRH